MLWFVIVGSLASKDAPFPGKYKLTREVQNSLVNLRCFLELNFFKEVVPKISGSIYNKPLVVYPAAHVSRKSVQLFG